MKVKIGPYPTHRWYHNWLYEKFDYTPKQSVKVHIDGWDTWSMDYTLAEIVLPMLKQLKADKNGSPIVEDEDVPHLPKQGEASMEGYQLDMFACDEHDHEVWEQYVTRWDWIMDEMIYAFDCKVNKDETWMRFDDPEEAQKEQDRISNGFRLFGKYYEGLWD